MDFDNSESPCRFFTSIVRELKLLAIGNIEHFQDGKLSHHAKFHVAFCMLFEYLDLGIEPCFREISARVNEFDASPTEKGNGYRSLLRIVQKCCLHLLQISRHITTNRESMLFRRAFYMKELEAYVATLGQLRACLYYAQKLMVYCQDGQLFADEEGLDNVLAIQLMEDVELLSSECFYGRCLGFQFCESMQRPLHLVAIAMASFGEGYQESSQLMKVATSFFNSGKYIMNPDLRAQQVVNLTRTADIQFCKAFWSITESDVMHQLPSMVCPAVAVDEVFHLGPDAFDMPSADASDTITINPPCAHTGPAPVQVRLISHKLRDGQEQHLKFPGAQRSPRCPGLLVHCHGGGFVAQSSRSHEVYLRDWARALDVPILSVDYSLAPESPFPRALEECFYAYAWAVHNCHKLGSTGEVIVLAGDSAGGNLMVTTAMRAASFQIRRPDGLLGIYPAVLVRYTPSPSRILSLMDPLLPAGVLSRCLAAYAGVSEELSSQLATSGSCHIESSAATLRMSAQEQSDSEWVLVSQDAACARAKTTLASPTIEEEEGEREGEEEVEIFSRPPRSATTGSNISSMVSGATEKLASYVGSYTNLLTKSFTATSSRSSPEEFPLKTLLDGGGGWGSVDGSVGGSSTDESPSTPSFHTPLTTPTHSMTFAHSKTSGSAHTQNPSPEEEPASSPGDKTSASHGPAVQIKEGSTPQHVGSSTTDTTTTTTTTGSPLSTPSDGFEILEPGEEESGSAMPAPPGSGPLSTAEGQRDTAGGGLGQCAADAEKKALREIQKGGNPTSTDSLLRRATDEDKVVTEDNPDNTSAVSAAPNPKPTPRSSTAFETTSKSALRGARSDSVDVTASVVWADPLLSPDSGCLSDEADPASTWPADKAMAQREKLHLHLPGTSSDPGPTPTLTLPRSASLPAKMDRQLPRGGSHSMSPSDFKRERHLAQSPLRAIQNIAIVRNPFMSPLLASDALLQGLPHISLVACHLDPLLDESIMFARRLRSLGLTVDLELLDDLPHGFLNFSLFSRDAKRGSDICVAKLRGLLRLDQSKPGSP